jgi:hypothetical protein
MLEYWNIGRMGQSRIRKGEGGILKLSFGLISEFHIPTSAFFFIPCAGH